MIRTIIDYWLVLVLGLGAALIFFRTLRTRATDARFGVRRVGGRGGTIYVSFPTYDAQAEFELGADIDLIVYPQSLRDSHGRPLEKHQQYETVNRLWSWASARGLRLDIPGFSRPPELSA